ncbi:hypothetical protein F0562_009527 [Nyssa sinensis]|uniref:Uncharacterized protein n=1 Tax=Nyssa sinensis TaxID=561372 RepID=A0A5J4ZYW7_9ASTE|nr:hypothetical protein F0562_009527 [Nyssa sinensis]
MDNVKHYMSCRTSSTRPCPLTSLHGGNRCYRTHIDTSDQSLEFNLLFAGLKLLGLNNLKFFEVGGES